MRSSHVRQSGAMRSVFWLLGLAALAVALVPSTQLSAVLVSDGMRRGVAPTVPEAVLTWREGSRSAVPATAAAAMYRHRASLG